MDITEIVTTVQLILALLSFITNGLLIMLIIFKSPKTLGTYKYLMIFMSIFEIFYAVIDLLVKPEVRTNNYYWMSETNSRRSILSLSIAYPLLLIWACSFGIALACFGVHFVFRYFIVTGNNKWISGLRASCLWLIFPATVGFVYALTIHIFLHYDDVTDMNLRFYLIGEECTDISDFRTEIAVAEGILTNQTIFFRFSLYKTLNEQKFIDWSQIYGVSLLSSVITISFVTMIYFGIKCYLAIKTLNDSQDSSSTSSKNLQTQLFYSLVIQTIIPIALIHFPTTLIFVSAFFGASHELYGHIITVTISMFPAIDPIPSLIIIKPYRQTIKNFLHLQSFRRKVLPLSLKASNHLTSNFSGRAPTI